MKARAIIDSLPPYAHDRRRELERYLEAVGEEAFLRQIELHKVRHGCCWEPNDQPHHPACPVGKRQAAA